MAIQKSFLIVTLLTLAPLAGCGLADTGVSAAAGAAMAAEDAKRAKEAQARIERDLAKAQAAAAEQRQQAESMEQ